jgi:hypothetical protein
MLPRCLTATSARRSGSEEEAPPFDSAVAIRELAVPLRTLSLYLQLESNLDRRELELAALTVSFVDT